jgi:CRP/FNR family cyclic AMP-dependent transcriptional regulator
LLASKPIPEFLRNFASHFLFLNYFIKDIIIKTTMAHEGKRASGITEPSRGAKTPTGRGVSMQARNIDEGDPILQPTGILMADKMKRPVDWEALLAGVTRGKTVIEYGTNRNVFRQGQPADSLFYLRRGKVKLAVASRDGKEAIIAILDTGEFFGEGCLAGQQLRMATATALTDCSLLRIERPLMARLIQERHDISELFVAHLLARNIRYEADLVDQLFNSSEKRLARILLLISHFGKESREEPVLPRVSQDDLAQMVGTTRSRVSHFMNKFRKLGFINYNDSGGLTVHSSLLSVVLHD